MNLTGKIILGALYLSIAVAILATAMLVVPKSTSQYLNAIIGGEKIIVTLANTPELHAKGLSGHRPLAEKEGMLFVFPRTGRYGFWMKDMLFPIDIIWFDADRKIVDVWESASPESYPKSYTPRSFSQFVLEVPAGFYLEHNLKIGNSFKILQ